MYLCSPSAPQSLLQTLLQRCYHLVISCLLDLVSRNVSNWLFRLFWRISKCILCSPRAPQSPFKTLLQRCYHLVISSLLDLVSRYVPTGYFVSAGGFRIYLCRPCAPQSPLRLFSRDVTGWLFRLYWILFPEMSQLVISSLLEDSECICARLVHHSLP